MCVAIVAKKGAILTGGELYRGWQMNSDGGGFAYIGDDNKVKIESGFLTYNDFDNAYQRIIEKYVNNGPMLIHMRIRSTGSMGPENCHPFPIRGGALIHNGTMFWPDPPEVKPGKTAIRKSDTRVFAESLFNILKLEHIQKAEDGILGAIGRGNKLAFLYDGGQYFIMNERNGYWDGDRWFSNSSCKANGKSHS